MNEKELGEALLKWDARGPLPTVDPHKVVASVLESDRRRVRRLAACAIVLWTLAGIGIPVCSFLYLEYMFPMINWVMQQIITGESEKTPQQLADTAEFLVHHTLEVGTYLVTGSVILLLAAAGCTIWLVFAARRATLREVNANLAAIAEQLRRLAGNPAKE
jgi:hypothetical protein